MKILDHRQMSDFRSVLQMMPEHCTVEPFIEGVEDLRIQKIGANYRAFRRQSLSGEWKTNTGTSHMEEVAVDIAVCTLNSCVCVCVCVSRFRRHPFLDLGLESVCVCV